MSKAFEQFLEQSKKDGLTLYPGPLHNAAYVAWNAALEHAAKVCDSMETEWDCEDRAQSAAALYLAKAIRKEKTE